MIVYALEDRSKLVGLASTIEGAMALYHAPYNSKITWKYPPPDQPTSLKAFIDPTCKVGSVVVTAFTVH